MPTLDTLHLLQQHTAAFPFETLNTFTAGQCRSTCRRSGASCCSRARRLLLRTQRALPGAAAALQGLTVPSQAAWSWAARKTRCCPGPTRWVRVRVGGRDWLTDVGFGGMVPTAPLALDDAGAQPRRTSLSGSTAAAGATPCAPGSARRGRRCTSSTWRRRRRPTWRWATGTCRRIPIRPSSERLVAARTRGPFCRHALRGGSYALHHVGTSQPAARTARRRR